jgi:hypothetical protein
MSPRHSRRGGLRPITLVLLVAGGIAAAAQSRDTLETKVTADGDMVLLDWSKKHPWDAALLEQGAAMIAEYRTSRGIASEVVGKATARDRNDRTLRFRLPDRLTGDPVGPVCLLFELANRQVLPIRQVNRRGDDTARFQSEGWTAVVQAQAAARRRELQAAELQRAVAAKQRDVVSQEATAAASKWTSPGGCDSLQPPRAADLQAPPPPAEHDAVARQVCISRVAWGEQRIAEALAEARAEPDDEAAARIYVMTATEVVRSPLRLQQEVQVQRAGGGAADVLASRTAQLDRMLADWQRWSGAAATYRAPAFGEFRDTLDLQSSASDAALRLFGARLGTEVGLVVTRPLTPQPVDRPGYIGGSLEAYDRCVTDGKSQLQTKFRNWQELQATAATRASLEKAQLAAACRTGLATLGRLQGELQAMQRQQQELAVSAVLPTAASLPRTAAVLNGVACVP